jgi:hypothetical protein
MYLIRNICQEEYEILLDQGEYETFILTKLDEHL